jgi:glycosyltransferase involved in cell wall biosynthesis
LDSISIIIPAYNEEKRLPATLNCVLEYLGRRTWSFIEVLVVDDGSTDGTAAVAEEFHHAHPLVHVLRNQGNRGKGYSVRHGMRQAKGDWILFTDADLSTPIEELDKLISSAAVKKTAVVIGSRALDRTLIEIHQTPFRETAGRLFNLFVRAVTGLPLWDTQCGFKLFEHRAAQEIFRRQRLDRFAFDVEVLFIAQKLGFTIVETPVRWSHSEGTKVSMFKDSLNMLLDLARVRWYALRGRYD